MAWCPKLNPATEVRLLPLTAEEGLVLSRIDGVTELAQLSELTRLPVDVVSRILARLASFDAIDSEPLAPPAREPDALEQSEDLEDATGSTQRALFETRLHSLAQDERVRRAKSADEPELTAFCFDPAAAVIAAILENANVGLSHARLIARHHRTPQGLDALAQRATLAGDSGVRRWLVRNPLLSAGLFRRLFTAQRLLVLYKLSIDRDIPEQTRRLAHELMRTRFSSGAAEEKIELLFKTEGRCLAQLSAVPLDSKTSSMLCGRPYASALFIQHLARWESTPPPLIAHLLRQELVKRQPQLRAALARHPNAPASSKVAR